MTEIAPSAEISALVDACRPGGAYSRYPYLSHLYDVLERHGFVLFHEGNIGPMATITPAGKARLKKLVDQLTRSAPNV